MNSPPDWCFDATLDVVVDPEGRRLTQRKKAGFLFPQLRSQLEVCLRGRGKRTHAFRLPLCVFTLSRLPSLRGALCGAVTLPSLTSPTLGSRDASATWDAGNTINVKDFFFLSFFSKGQCCDSASQPAAPPLPFTHRPEEPKLAAAVPLLSDTGRETSHDVQGRVSKGKVVCGPTATLLWRCPIVQRRWANICCVID